MLPWNTAGCACRSGKEDSVGVSTTVSHRRSERRTPGTRSRCPWRENELDLGKPQAYTTRLQDAHVIFVFFSFFCWNQIEEYHLPDIVRSMQFCGSIEGGGDILVLGMRKDYLFFHTKTGTPSEIRHPGRQSHQAHSTTSCVTLAVSKSR